MNNSLVALDIEEAFLGSIIIDDSLSTKLNDICETCFSTDKNKEIYKCMVDLSNNKKKLDISTVKQYLNDKNVDVDISYLSNITSFSYSYAIDNYIDTLNEKAKRRNILSVCEKLLNNVVTGEDLESSIYNFENKMKNYIR